MLELSFATPGISHQMADPESPVAGTMADRRRTVEDADALSPVFSGWSLAILVTITCLVTWTTIERFMDPVSEKYVKALLPGSADFFFPFGGARALLLGENPYLNEIPGLEDPWDRQYGRVGGKQYRGLYPPTHFLLYLPLAMITDDWRKAGRILFVLNLAVLALLAVITWKVVARIGSPGMMERHIAVPFVLLYFVILTTNVGTSLGLERGDGGDIWATALCWSAVVLSLQRRWFLAMFLLVPAMFTKGNPVWFGLGLGLLGLTRRTWVSVVGGALAGLIVFLAPVARYIPESLTLLANYPGIVGNSFWWNHGFGNVFLHVSPGLADVGRWTLIVYCALLAMICWVKARQALHENSSVNQVLWVVLFTTCSIEIMLGSPKTSIVYNLVLVMPGMLILFAVGPTFCRACGLPAWAKHLIGALNLAAAFLVFKFILFDWAGFPSAGIGMILFLLTIGMAMSWGWWRARRPIAQESGNGVG